jgi:hypothetical protein
MFRRLKRVARIVGPRIRPGWAAVMGAKRATTRWLAEQLPPQAALIGSGVLRHRAGGIVACGQARGDAARSITGRGAIRRQLPCSDGVAQRQIRLDRRQTQTRRRGSAPPGQGSRREVFKRRGGDADWACTSSAGRTRATGSGRGRRIRFSTRSSSSLEADPSLVCRPLGASSQSGHARRRRAQDTGQNALPGSPERGVSGASESGAPRGSARSTAQPS